MAVDWKRRLRRPSEGAALGARELYRDGLPVGAAQQVVRLGQNLPPLWRRS